jgi:hypothetical protein
LHKWKLIHEINLLSLINPSLVYPPVLPHGLIRINIKIKLITNNYNYLPHALFHLLDIITHTLKYIFIIIYLVAIDFILHHTSMCV